MWTAPHYFTFCKLSNRTKNINNILEILIFKEDSFSSPVGVGGHSQLEHRSSCTSNLITLLDKYNAINTISDCWLSFPCLSTCYVLLHNLHWLKNMTLLTLLRHTENNLDCTWYYHDYNIKTILFQIIKRTISFTKF